MLLHFFSALALECCICGWCCLVGLGGLWGGRGSYWRVSSYRRPLCSRYQVKAITTVVFGFIFNEERRILCFIFFVCFEKALDGCGIYRTPFSEPEYLHASLKIKAGDKWLIVNFLLCFFHLLQWVELINNNKKSQWFVLHPFPWYSVKQATLHVWRILTSVTALSVEFWDVSLPLFLFFFF